MRFDRPFLERRFPELGGRLWACTISDIDWAQLGFSGRALPQLLVEAGYFYAAHRAGPDSWALACLLSLEAPDGRTHAAHLVDAVRTPTMRVYAAKAPFEVKDRLKARGYRWCPVKRLWWTDMALGADEAERAWLASVSSQIMPVVQRITGYERHG